MSGADSTTGGTTALIPYTPTKSENDLGDPMTDGIAKILSRIHAEEHRNVLGRPKKYQLIDFIGVGYGLYFLWDGWNRPKPKMLNLFIGSTMVYIHSLRYFYAPQIKRETV